MKPELLAPVGNKEALVAAIEAGCDAVYLAGYSFGARSYAGNFSDTELREAVEYAHLYDVLVYVTVNTLIYQSETERFFDYIDYLYHINVDALIVQDLGMMDYIKQVYPDFELHASTQMHIHTLKGAQKVESWGLKRTVLARETSIEEIENIKKNTNIDLEVFVHGALCLSYSGQCLMSSMIGGRSGNRGTCTQCCRMKYDLIKDNKKVNKNKYLLSTKDLNTLSSLENLLKIGVNSFKIEGRMKRPEYVYLIVSLYRRAIDSYFETGKCNINEEDILECEKIFSRSFTKGFLMNEKNNDIINQDRPNHRGIYIGTVASKNSKYVTIKLEENLSLHDGIRIVNEKEDQGTIITQMKVDSLLTTCAKKNQFVTIPFNKTIEIGDKVYKTTDSNQLNQINLKQKENLRKVFIDGTLYCQVGEPLKLELRKGNVLVSVTSDFKVEQAKNIALSDEKLKDQLSKLGGTVYQFHHLEINNDNNSFINLKELNELRRKAIQELTNKRLKRILKGKQKYCYETKEYLEKQGYTALINNISDYDKVKDYDAIYISSDNYEELPKLVQKVSRVNPKENNYKEALIGEIGSIRENMITDFSFNVTNSYTVAFLHNLGIKRITLSYELTEEQIIELVTEYQKLFDKQPNLEVIISSYPEVMISKFRLLNYYNLDNTAYLVDEKGHQFKVNEDEYGMHIYHYEKKIIKNSENLLQNGITKLRIEI